VRERIASEIDEALARPGGEAELLEKVSPLPLFDLSEVVLEVEPESRLKLVSLLPADIAAGVLEYLEPEEQYRILHKLSKEVAKPLLNAMSSDAVVDMLLAIHPHQAERLLAWLPKEYRDKIDELMTFPEGTAGSLATVDYIAVRESWTVERTLEHIRKVANEAEVVSYAYVVNAMGQLTDVVSMRELILADPKARLGDIANNYVISVKAHTDQEEAARILSQYDFVALPVVDDKGRLIGVVTVDDLFDVVRDEATEDVQKLGGSQPLEGSYFETPVGVLFRKRVVWLLVLFAGQAYTSTVIRHFESTLAEAVALAFFIPLLIGTGGNTGSQTVAILVRSLAVGEVGFGDMLRVLGRELATGALLGVTLGAATYLRAVSMGLGYEIGPVVAVSGLFIVVWAAVVAGFLPLMLHRLRVDPALVSGPLITTIVDGTGLFLYFTLARIMLGLA